MRVRSKKDFPETPFHKIFETNSSFNVKLREKLISVFQKFFAIIDKMFILAGGLGTRLSFYEFGHFPDIS